MSEVDQLFAEYRKMAEAVEKEWTLLRSKKEQYIRCRPGCISCCRSFNVVLIEAIILGEAFRQLQPEVRKLVRDQAGRPGPRDTCVFLVEDQCAVYAARPLLCRSQGLPVAYIHEEKETIEVSACPKNFPESYPLRHEDLFFMDHFNRRLAELNSEYCRMRRKNPLQRIPMHEIVFLEIQDHH